MYARGTYILIAVKLTSKIWFNDWCYQVCQCITF